MRELTIASSGVRALLELAVLKGANRTILLERSMIDPSDLSDRDNRIAFSKYVALMRAGQELLSDPALALHFGEAVDVSDVSIACTLAGLGVANIDEAFAQVNRYASLGADVERADGGDHYQLKRFNGQLWIVDQRRNPNEFPELTESGFAGMICSTRRTFPQMKFHKEMHFTHSAPSYRDEYERIFQVPIVFDSTENAMRIDEALVAKMQLPRTSPYVTSVLRDHAEELLQKIESERSTRDRVENVLTAGLKDGNADVACVARKLGLSRQTLFRKLRDEGVTFQGVLAELRCSLAKHYLNDQKVSVKETAYLLGFSDPTAFSRAFKRWTGQAPAACTRVSERSRTLR